MQSEKERRILLKEMQIDELCRERDKQGVLYNRTGDRRFKRNYWRKQGKINSLIQDINYLEDLTLISHI